MKKFLFTLALIATTAVSYGQGTVAFNNGTLTRITIDGVNATAAQGLTIGLFYGTSAGSLTLAADRGTIGGTAGVFSAPNGALYQIPGSTSAQTGVFLQVRAWSSSFGTDWQAAQTAAASNSSVYFGQTSVIQTDLGPTAGPATVLWQTAAGTNPARFTPLAITTVPEPSTFALGALGIGALLMVRRRKV